jgi:hypothetical protein
LEQALFADRKTGVVELPLGVTAIAVFVLSSYARRPLYLYLAKANEGRRSSVCAALSQSARSWSKPLVALTIVQLVSYAIFYFAFAVTALSAGATYSAFRSHVTFTSTTVIFTVVLAPILIAPIPLYIFWKYVDAGAFGICIFERPSAFWSIGKALRSTFSPANLTRSFKTGTALSVVALAIHASVFGLWKALTNFSVPFPLIYSTIAAALGATFLEVYLFVVYVDIRVRRDGLDLAGAMSPDRIGSFSLTAPVAAPEVEAGS